MPIQKSIKHPEKCQIIEYISNQPVGGYNPNALKLMQEGIEARENLDQQQKLILDTVTRIEEKVDHQSDEISEIKKIVFDKKETQEMQLPEQKPSKRIDFSKIDDVPDFD